MINKLKILINLLTNKGGILEALDGYTHQQLANMKDYRNLFSGSSNRVEYEDFQLAEALSKIAYPKYKFSEFGNIYLDDIGYSKYYEKFMDPNNWHSYDRKFVVNQMLKLTERVKGDIAECGTYKGATAYLLCKFGKEHLKEVHLFDSFEGLSEPLDCDGKYWKKGSLKTTEESLINNLNEFNNYKVYKGWIPERFSDVKNTLFSFLHIDVDLYQPTLDTMEFFMPRVSTGGIVICDDYGFKSCPGAKAAFDEMAAKYNTPVVQLPTGQAFIVKGS